MIAKPLSLPHPDRVRSCDDSILGGGVGGGRAGSLCNLHYST